MLEDVHTQEVNLTVQLGEKFWKKIIIGKKIRWKSLLFRTILFKAQFFSKNHFTDRQSVMLKVIKLINYDITKMNTNTLWEFKNNLKCFTSGKAYDITYVRLKFQSPRPASFAIYKKDRRNPAVADENPDENWWQFNKNLTY